MATGTADGLYDYYEKVISSNGLRKTFIDHSCAMNVYLEVENSWAPKIDRYGHPISPLGPGRWGTDINVSRIGHALKTTNKYSSIDEIAAAVHAGWSACYKYWYENRPWDFAPDALYFCPGKNLLSRQKLTRCSLSYDQLDKFQQKMCRQMATYIKNECM
jgi:hypothetical protein